jgi:hypothetical protein
LFATNMCVTRFAVADAWTVSKKGWLLR